jgi:protein-S-isoprenylcysteine O-methyltransferase Ste14
MSDNLPEGDPTATNGASATAAAAVTGEPAAASGLDLTPAQRDLMPRLIELVTFILAMVGAIALGLGITDYLSERPYVYGYLLAYAGFRIADAMVRPAGRTDMEAYAPSYQRYGDLPLLLFFAAAPFERTYIYGGDSPRWLGALGLLIELVGLWIALGARIQLDRFIASDRARDGDLAFVSTGFYRYIRHPVYAGTFLALLAWPLEYGAPIVWILTLIAGANVIHRRIDFEEGLLLERFGPDYAAYIQATDRLIPSVY